jgi:hypothetical protein
VAINLLIPGPVDGLDTRAGGPIDDQQSLTAALRAENRGERLLIKTG